MTQTVLVTGGTSGIGAGVADVLNIAGYQVIAATVSQEEIDQYEGAPEIETCLMDVTDSASVEGVFKKLHNLSGLVNCAGILVREKEYDIDVFNEVGNLFSNCIAQSVFPIISIVLFSSSLCHSNSIGSIDSLNSLMMYLSVISKSM